MEDCGIHPMTSWQIDGEKYRNSDRLLFSWTQKSLQMVTAGMKLKKKKKKAYSLEENL